MKDRKVTILGIVLGVVVLALVAILGILLPNVEPSSDPEGTGSVPELPASLGPLVALDSDQLPQALAAQIGDVSQVTDARRQAVSGLDAVFGAPAAYRIYASEDASTLAAVTVIDKAPGLFSPDGPPSDPSSGQQPTYQLSRVGGAVCAEYYGQAQSPTGQPSGQATLTRAHCQLGANGRTYDIDSRGLSARASAAALRMLAAEA